MAIPATKHEYRDLMVEIVKDVKPRIYVEVGARAGVLARRIAEFDFVEQVHMVDPWWVTPQHPEQKEHEEAFRSCKKLCDRNPKCQMHRGLSHELVTEELLFPLGFADMVHIDGDHSYEFVKVDIRSWIDKVKPGGELNGDDYQMSGVKRAVNECFNLKDVSILQGRIWRYTVPPK